VQEVRCKQVDYGADAISLSVHILVVHTPAKPCSCLSALYAGQKEQRKWSFSFCLPFKMYTTGVGDYK
jgi:hypothetical protein